MIFLLWVWKLKVILDLFDTAQQHYGVISEGIARTKTSLGKERNGISITATIYTWKYKRKTTDKIFMSRIEKQDFGADWLWLTNSGSGTSCI